MEGKSHNAGHVAIAEYIDWSEANDEAAILVTQNIDNLHTSAQTSDNRLEKKEGTADFAHTKGVFEVHGNPLYMRCPDFCDKVFYVKPSRE